MSGTRLFNFRQGDRSEYLALYLLSGLGLVTQIPRQEDIGFDFVCSIADQEFGRLTFNHQYLVSVKSKSSPNIDLAPPEGKENDVPHHIDWFFRLEVPLILCVVDKDVGSIAFYSTLPSWFIYYENRDCRSLSLVPRLSEETGSDVGRPKKGALIGKAADMYHYDVDLGHPFAVFSHDDLANGARLKTIKERLRLALRFANLSILHARIGVPNFYWFAETKPDCSKFTPAFFFRELPHDSGIQNRVFSEIAPTLVSLAMHYKEQANADLLTSVGKLLKLAPPNSIPDLVKDHLPEIFANP